MSVYSAALDDAAELALIALIGSAMQDAAAAWPVIRRARALGLGRRISP